MKRLVLLALPALLADCLCGAPPVPNPPPIKAAPTGFFIGEAFSDGESVGGVRVSVYGTTASATSVAGKQFVLQPIPVRTHTVDMASADGRFATRFQQALDAGGETVLLSAGDTTLRAPATLTGTVVLSDGQSPVGAVVYLVQGDADQVAPVGDDGTFSLSPLPVGHVAIGVSKAGYDIDREEVDLAEGTQDFGNAIQLSPLQDTAALVNITSKVLLAGETDHSGTTVLVDDGDQIVITDAAGSFTAAVAPGRHSLTAERPGFDTVELPSVSVSESGSVDEGLVEIFLAPSTASNAAPPPPPPGDGPVLTIEAPAAGSELTAGVPLPFTASIANVSPTSPLLSQIEWRVRVVGDSDPGALLGTGSVLAATLPASLAGELLEITAEVPGEDLLDSVAVSARQFLKSEVRPGIDAVLVPPPAATVAADGVLEVHIQQGHPAILAPADAVSVSWTSDTGLDFAQQVDLGVLPVGTHTFTAHVATPDGLVDALDVRVIVDALQFDLTVVQPAAGTVFFTDQPLPLQVQVTHGFEPVFPQAAVAWRTDAGTQLAAGAIASTFSAPTGSQALLVDVTDAVGNVRSAVVDYQLEPISFTASFNAPADNLDVQQGDPVTFNIGFSHSRVASDDPSVTVSLTSNLQGPIGSGAPNSDITVTDLVPGTHTITARVVAGGRIATATHTVVVEAPFVTATVTQPALHNVLALDGTAMRFTVQVGASQGATPRVSWLLDGQEFDPAWDNYGADPLAGAVRSDVNLGNYTQGAGIFADPRWGAGAHVVQAWVRLDDPAVEALGCTNAGVASRCVSINVQVFQALEDKGLAGDVTLTSTDPVERWSGGIVLHSRYFIEGGTLIIDPGTTVVVDMANRTNPANQDSSGGRGIQLREGTLQVGGAGNVPPVVFQTRKQFAQNNNWDGIRNLSGAPGGALRVLSLQNVVVRDANAGVNLGFTSMLPDAEPTFENVRVENSDRGITVACPSTFNGVSFANIRNEALTLQDDALCPPSTDIANVDIEGAGTGILVSNRSAVRTYNFTNIVVDGAGTGIDLRDNVEATVDGSSFKNVGPGNQFSEAVLMFGTNGSLEVTNSTFENDGAGVVFQVSAAGHLEVDGNSFTRSTRAVRTLTQGTADIHLNSFIQSSSFDIAQESSHAVDVDARGNFFGDFGDASTTGGQIARAPTGLAVPLSRILDGFDDTNSSIIRVDNPLPTASLPEAYISEPTNTETYTNDTCIPFVAAAPLSGIDVDACTWSIFPIGGDPAAGTAVTVQAGCAQDAVASGDHGVALTCGGVLEQVSRFHVDDTHLPSRIQPPGLTVAAGTTRTVGGDIIVEPGATLTLEPGSHLLVSAGDAAHDTLPATDGGRLGSNGKSELIVQGTLAVGAPGASSDVVIEPTSAGASPGFWGGIITARGGVATFDHAVINGASTVSIGDFATNDPFTAPDVRFRDVSIANVTDVSRGVCPRELTRVDLDNVDLGAFDCNAAADFIVTGGTWTNLKSSQSMMRIDNFTTRIVDPAVTIDGLSLHGSTSNASAIEMRGVVANLFVSNSTFEAFGRLVTATTTAGTLNVADSTLRQFTDSNQGLFEVLGNSSVDVSHSLIQGGPHLVTFDCGSFTLRDSRVVDVPVPFNNLSTQAFDALTVNGSQFENAQDVFDIDSVSNNAGVALGYDLSGNNFIGTTDKVLRIRNTATALQTQYDLSGSFFGTGVDTNAEVEALITDPRTDASPSDQIVGKTDYSGFSTSALTLGTP